LAGGRRGSLALAGERFSCSGVSSEGERRSDVDEVDGLLWMPRPDEGERAVDGCGGGAV
jgi:hypothetical protein